MSRGHSQCRGQVLNSHPQQQSFYYIFTICTPPSPHPPTPPHPHRHPLINPPSHQACSACLKTLPESGGFPCRRCPLVLYCSPDCRSADRGHQGGEPEGGSQGGPECGVPWTLLLAPDATLGVRIAAKLAQVGPICHPRML